MKRPLIITVGIVIVLMVLGVWVYLLFFGTPKDIKEVPTNLGFEFTPREARVVEQIEESGYRVDTSSGLQQLTTKPVAGFTSYSATTSSSTIVRYVEQGTGHIYDINIDTGEEEIVSRTTIPRVREAVFSPSGDSIALTSIEGDNRTTFWGKIKNEQSLLEGENITPDAENIEIKTDSEVNYTVKNEEGSIGYTYNIETGELREIFRIPFREVIVIWGSPIYFYNKPDSSLLGYLYKIENGSYTTTDIYGYGLVVEGAGSYLGYSKKDNDYYKTNFLNLENQVNHISSLLLIPEKCDYLNNHHRIVCAQPREGEIDLSQWYKGTKQTNDRLWISNIASSSNTLISDLEASSGRPIDIKELSIDKADSLIMFSNKLDNTLWKFDI